MTSEQIDFVGGALGVEVQHAPLSLVMACKSEEQAMELAIRHAESRGATQGQIAAAMQVSQPYLSQVVSGARPVPARFKGGRVNFRIAFAVATKYDVALRWHQLEQARIEAQMPTSPREEMDRLERLMHTNRHASDLILEGAADASDMQAVIVRQAMEIAELKAQLAEAARHGLIDRRAS